MHEEPVGGVLVVGGGIAGQRTAVELAEAGLKVHLVDSAPWLGGRVAQLGVMFPTHDCVLCRATSDHGYGCPRPTISPAFLDQNRHPNIDILTHSDVVDVDGQEGDFTVRIRRRPTYVNPDLCINCGLCAGVCPVDLPDAFQQGLDTHKAIYKMAPRAVPDSYVVERVPTCDECHKCEEVCPTKAVDLAQEPEDVTLHVGAIVAAVGFDLSQPDEYGELGHGRFPNVLHSMEYERLASRSGPTEGIVRCPSDGEPPERVAWLQCVGSRNEDHPYCSSICCMFATKEARLAKRSAEQIGHDLHCEIFIMDDRAFSKEFDAYYQEAREDAGLVYTRCRIQQVLEDPETHELILRYPTEGGEIEESRFDMVVLSLGSRPPDRARDLADLLGIELNPFGFCATTKLSPLGTSQPGIYVAGAFSAPKAMAETILDSVGVAGRVMEQLSAHVGEFASGREYPFLWGGEELPPERDVSDEEPRVGVFVCRCRPAISDVVDTEALAEYARGLEDVVCVETVDYACLSEGQERFQQMVAEHGINRAVVAACSHRTHAALFQRLFRQQGLNPYFVELANVREQCAWAHPDDPTGATRKAKEMVRLACASARLSRPVRREGLEPTRRALIVGGGLAGMTSALNIADAGFDVTLVEREAELGGNLRRLFYLGEDVAEDPQELLRGLVERVTGHERIDVLTEATLTSHEGSLGAFHSQVATDAGPVTIDHGVTIVATGGREYQGDEYLHGVDDRVITNLTLEETLAHHPERAQELEQVVFIQCVGRPDPFVRCSRTCCTNTMKNALRLKTLNPECQVVVLYKDIMTFGFRETLYTEARERGVLFVRFDYDQKPAVRVDEDGALAVDAWEPSLAQTITLRPDLVSLSMPPSPAEGTSDLADVLDVPLSSEAFFMETHPKMRPMDFAREGVFVSGLAHYPKFVEETIASAQAVAGRALQVLSTPRLFIGGVVSVVDQEKCVGCLTCVRTCPFGVPKVRYDDVGVGGLQGAAYIDPASCTGCGICTAECPAKAIQLGAFHDEQIIGLPLGAWAAEPVAA